MVKKSEGGKTAYLPVPFSAEVGERFALAVEATVEALAEYPLQFPLVYRSRRRAGVRRFPYGIFFEVQDNRIVVIACFHGRRDPRRWAR
jgi:plasmid stabilization system protein ParE